MERNITAPKDVAALRRNVNLLLTTSRTHHPGSIVPLDWSAARGIQQDHARIFWANAEYHNYSTFTNALTKFMNIKSQSIYINESNENGKYKHQKKKTTAEVPKDELSCTTQHTKDTNITEKVE